MLGVFGLCMLPVMLEACKRNSIDHLKTVHADLLLTGQKAHFLVWTALLCSGELALLLSELLASLLLTVLGGETPPNLGKPFGGVAAGLLLELLPSIDAGVVKMATGSENTKLEASTVLLALVSGCKLASTSV